MTIYFTADTHFGHKNIIKHVGRPFGDVAEMDRTIIARWNGIVAPDDIVYHLGDFTLTPLDTALNYFSELNGQIRILGLPWHHDKWLVDFTGGLSATGHPVKVLPALQVLDIAPAVLGLHGKYPIPITLSHYEMATWDRAHYGGWCLYGHDHRKTNTQKAFKLNVGVDAWDFVPVALETIKQALVAKGWYYGWAQHN